eukprot:1144106-Pelagomonas_calceolata.AAC.1
MSLAPNRSQGRVGTCSQTIEHNSHNPCKRKKSASLRLNPISAYFYRASSSCAEAVTIVSFANQREKKAN